MLFGEGPQIKNIAADLNKLFRQGSLLNQSGQTVEGDSTADQGTSDLLAARDPVIQEISVGMSGEQSARYTVSGTPPLSLPNSLGKPLNAWSVDLLPYQAGTGDPSPSNVRPIHGTDKLTITTAGKNLLQILPTESTVSNGVTFTVNADGTISTQGTASGTAVFRHYITASDLPAGEDLALNGVPSGGGWATKYGLAFCNANGAVIGTADSGSGTTISASSLSELAQVQIVVRNGINANGKLFTPMIRLASITDSSFAPYLAPSQTVIDVPVLSANQWDEEWELGGFYTATGLPWATSDRIRSKNFIPVVPNTVYYICVPNGNNTTILFYDSDQNFIVGSSAAKFNTTFAVPENAVYMRFNTGSAYGATYNHDIAINYPSTVTTYNPYNATVYTGTIGSEGGVSRWGEVDLGTLTWQAISAGNNVFTAFLTGAINNTGMGNMPLTMCEQYATTASKSVAQWSSATENNVVSLGYDSARVYIRDESYSDAAVFKAAVTGIKLIYGLKDPVQFPLTTPTIPTPTGTATAWATAEDGTVDSMDVTYVGKA